MDYYRKYLKYKAKYLELKEQIGAGCDNSRIGDPNYKCECEKKQKTNSTGITSKTKTVRGNCEWKEIKKK